MMRTDEEEEKRLWSSGVRVKPLALKFPQKIPASNNIPLPNPPLSTQLTLCFNKLARLLGVTASEPPGVVEDSAITFPGEEDPFSPSVSMVSEGRSGLPDSGARL